MGGKKPFFFFNLQFIIQFCIFVVVTQLCGSASSSSRGFYVISCVNTWNIVRVVSTASATSIFIDVIVIKETHSRVTCAFLMGGRECSNFVDHGQLDAEDG